MNRPRRSLLLTASAGLAVLSLAVPSALAETSKGGGSPAATGERSALAIDAAAQRAGAFASSVGALGSFYDESRSQHVVVMPQGVAASPAAAAKAVKAAVRIEERAVARSTVEAFQDSVAARAFHSAAQSYTYASYFDLVGGKLVLETNAPDDVIAPLLAGTPPAAVTVRQGVALEDFSRRADTQPFWGGSSIKSGNGICSSGFVVRKSNGTRYLTTAGHCWAVGSTVRTTDGNLVVGTVAQRAPISSRDMELIGGKSYGTHIFVGGTNSSTGKKVIGAGDPVVNFTGYCRSGQTTGERCGSKVVSVTANFCPTSGCKRNVIAYTGGTLSQNGDSGAPYYLPSGSSNVYIRGMHIGIGGSTMYAEKWSTIASTLAVTIVT